MPERPVQKALRTEQPLLRRGGLDPVPLRNAADVLTLARSAGYAKGERVCVYPTPGQNGRWSYSAAWSVYIPGKKTDPTEIHHGYKKRFSFGRADKNQALANALSWTAQHYGVEGDWDYLLIFRTRHYFPARLLNAVDALVTKRLENV